MTVRKFWLENQDGKEWHFTDEDSLTFLENPQGLGFAVDYGGYRLGNVEVVNYEQYQLNNITGTLMFFGNDRTEVYKQYFDFSNFIANNSLLKLHYKRPNSFESFYCYCFVSQLDKSETEKEYCVLRCNITFKKQTFWRNDEKHSLLVKNETLDASKKYALKRPYSYATSSLTDITIVNKGNIDTPLKITISGASTNPMFKIYTKDNVEYGAMKMLGTFDSVVVDSDDLNEYIELTKDGSILTAPFSYQDLTVGNPQQTYVTFIKVKSGESKAVFTYDGAFTGDILLEWEDQYVTV